VLGLGFAWVWAVGRMKVGTHGPVHELDWRPDGESRSADRGKCVKFESLGIRHQEESTIGVLDTMPP
jgi:hypothetical protein